VLSQPADGESTLGHSVVQVCARRAGLLHGSDIPPLKVGLGMLNPWGMAPRILPSKSSGKPSEENSGISQQQLEKELRETRACTSLSASLLAPLLLQASAGGSGALTGRWGRRHSLCCTASHTSLRSSDQIDHLRWIAARLFGRLRRENLSPTTSGPQWAKQDSMSADRSSLAVGKLASILFCSSRPGFAQALASTTPEPVELTCHAETCRCDETF